jgi:CubicO group peptidase (beta-lactamase class C family)
LAAFGSFLSTPVQAEKAKLDLAVQVDAIVSEYTEPGWFSGNIAITQSGDGVYQRSIGLADREQGVKNMPNTRIRIGSINKHYTAVLVLQKVQAGELSLNDSLANFELGFPDAIARRITVRHLLQHRSGFGDIFTEEYIQNYPSLKTIDDKLPLLMHAPLLSPAGEAYRYSNYGYIVLGAILERLEGRPFRQILEADILHTIGAQDTKYALTDAVTGKARSYHYDPEDGSNTDKTHMLENVTPDGGMYSTTGDIARFYNALFYSDKLLNDHFKAVLAQGFKPSSQPWSEWVSRSDAQWRSYGGGPGVSAAVEILFKDRIIVIVLANTDGLVAERISQRVIEVLDMPPGRG